MRKANWIGPGQDIAFARNGVLCYIIWVMGENVWQGRLALAHHHPWHVTPREGIGIQRRLSEHVRAADQLGPVDTVAGIDVSVKHDRSRAAVVVLRYPELTPCRASLATRPVTMPYIPGLLSFREVPVILDALAKLPTLPDLIIVDGQGIAHPRRMGIAAHLGVILDLPSIGCAKSRLCGQHEEPPPEKGGRALLYDGDEVIGAVLRTRVNVKPVFISIGHRVSLETAVDYVLNCCPRFKLPETTRWAHRVAGGAPLPPDVQLFV